MGTNCEVEVNNCEQQPCANGGTCKVGPRGQGKGQGVHEASDLVIIKIFNNGLNFKEKWLKYKIYCYLI